MKVVDVPQEFFNFFTPPTTLVGKELATYIYIVHHPTHRRLKRRFFCDLRVKGNFPPSSCSSRSSVRPLLEGSRSPPDEGAK